MREVTLARQTSLHALVSGEERVQALPRAHHNPKEDHLEGIVVGGSVYGRNISVCACCIGPTMPRRHPTILSFWFWR
jgi:hypothetical protein